MKSFLLFISTIIIFLPLSLSQYPWQRTRGNQHSSSQNYDPRYGQNRDGNFAYQPDTYVNNNNKDWRREWKQGDERCNVKNLELKDRTKSVSTRMGTFAGKYVYLCDSPTTAPGDRPQDQGGSGFTRDDFSARVLAFLGIPYAEPPVREYRFRAPQALRNVGSMDATEFKPSCVQHVNYTGDDTGITSMNEDCLYLNIYTPDVDTNVQKQYAVMMYIHGGNYDHGSGNTFPGHMLAATQEVVVVTFNYRLGALGFLATGDNSSAGNFGLLDQAAAIQWVYFNIESFNGDKNRITLFGPGAGAASAGIHVLSMKEKKQCIQGSVCMIKRVIAQSGSAVADWAAIQDPIFMRNVSRLYGEAVGCYDLSSDRLMECLKKKSENADEFKRASIKPIVGWLPWGPVLDRYTRDEPAVPKMPLDILKDKNSLFPQDFAYLTGVTRDEYSAVLKNDPELIANGYRVTQEIFRKHINATVRKYNYTLNEEGIYNAISFMYTPPTDARNESLLLQGLIDMYSDAFYVAPYNRIMKLLLENNVKTYSYVLNYTFTSPISRQPWEGVPHNIEYLLITGAPFMSPSFYPKSFQYKVYWSRSDRRMSEMFMKMWANFAKTGNPTVESYKGIQWYPMSLQHLQYLSINGTPSDDDSPSHNETSIMLTDYRQKQSQFWSFYLPSLVNTITPTWPPSEEPYLYERRLYRGSLWGVTGAAALFLILSVVGFCCYCRAKSRPLVDDEHFPDTGSNQSVTESTHSIKRIEFRNKYAGEKQEAKSLKNTRYSALPTQPQVQQTDL